MVSEHNSTRIVMMIMRQNTARTHKNNYRRNVAALLPAYRHHLYLCHNRRDINLIVRKTLVENLNKIELKSDKKKIVMKIKLPFVQSRACMQASLFLLPRALKKKHLLKSTSFSFFFSLVDSRNFHFMLYKFDCLSQNSSL